MRRPVGHPLTTGAPRQTSFRARLSRVCCSRARAARCRADDLRHGQASLMMAAGVELSVVSKRLGHSSISITNDTYSHLLGGVGRDAAERASSLVPRRRRAPEHLRRTSVTTR
ncbi:tyrosine-type recombinase/integrase [Streptomyces sp. NPDC052042]|uniref:tyrosine-type recombinase/integrase n=1 Tax=Streptomyces sp. NPDC052042 TaxID=3365683 RepID=UPI0037D90EFA